MSGPRYTGESRAPERGAAGGGGTGCSAPRLRSRRSSVRRRAGVAGSPRHCAPRPPSPRREEPPCALLGSCRHFSKFGRGCDRCAARKGWGQARVEKSSRKKKQLSLETFRLDFLQGGVPAVRADLRESRGDSVCGMELWESMVWELTDENESVCSRPGLWNAKPETWIITCFCLQLLLLNPLVKAQSSCGNPVTDDVNDIAKLVGNLPNDYMITLKYVPKMDSLPNHCWLHLMVPEFSRSLHNLLQKFSDISDMSDVLSNYSIINNLTRIINDLMACLAFDKNKDIVKENGHLYKEDRFIPEDFFRHFNSTIEVYKEFADRLDKNDCILPSTVETPENDSRVAVTKTFLFPPVAASSLRNDSIGSNTSSNKEALGFISSSSLQGISIALTSLLSLLIGFILGAIYWKKTHPKSRPESDETTQCHDCQEENEISMLQQKEKEHLQV
ncbi:PREDICTED: kit ligand [Calidris pugnax]|uniref:kit ligand n=1 Tax=Calidris pugnax TaxID=198806 RepID=UPI00071CFEEF|nr:PREDICTED: kit ligand [Calidris pugnax]